MYNEIKNNIEDLSKINPEKAQKYKMELIQIECKRRFPIGCKYKCPVEKKTISTLKENKYTYSIQGTYDIYAHEGGGLLYRNGVYAELVSLPETKDYPILPIDTTASITRESSSVASEKLHKEIKPKRVTLLPEIEVKKRTLIN